MHKLFTLLAILAVAASPVFATPPTPGKDMNKAIQQATAESKLAFILMGRETCENCQATRQMIKDSKVPVTSASFVMADINGDDPRVSFDFSKKFRKEKFGNEYPFVVITDSKGKALASYGGYKSPEQLTAIIQQAKAKVEAKAATKK